MNELRTMTAHISGMGVPIGVRNAAPFNLKSAARSFLLICIFLLCGNPASTFTANPASDRYRSGSGISPVYALESVTTTYLYVGTHLQTGNIQKFTVNDTSSTATKLTKAGEHVIAGAPR